MVSRVWGTGALCAVLSPCGLVVAVANSSTAADPAPALLAFFEGGRWPGAPCAPGVRVPRSRRARP
ncbi:hypothetical protein [Streptomyces sp. NPDC005955]|uniref:hypothetical protein n=1 Tax=Streptomyces sp. NPDC005955 TaxID=3364738 RepID=UPI00368A10B0